MNDSVHDGFLHRWARRKSLARTGALPDEPPAPAPPVQPADPGPDAAARASEGTESHPAEPALAPSAQESQRAETPALTLDDVRALTSDSDFTPFVSRQVAPEIKNAALKKLFADPHFNIMDGLDIYIDDYSAMEPMPPSMLRRLASAHALRMFDSPDDADAPAASQGPVATPPTAPADAAPADAASAGELASPAAEGSTPVRPATDAAGDPAACADASIEPSSDEPAAHGVARRPA